MGLRLEPTLPHSYNEMVACEPISFGIGVLRNARTDQTTWEALWGWLPQPKVKSDFVQVFGHQIIEIKDSGIKRDELWESTNIIYGDSFGELEQLIRRRHDKEFLEAYIIQLQRMGEPIEYPEEHDHPAYTSLKGLIAPYTGTPTFKWKMIHNDHKRWQQIWEEPPNTVDELIERANFLIKNTLIDYSSKEIRTRYEQ